MDIFKTIGFSPDQSTVYNTLLEYGQLPASVIASRSKVSRVITYKILGQFVDMGIVEKIEAPKSVALFAPRDPEHLRKLIDQKKSEIQSFETACETIITQVRPRFNLLSNKPGVLFYEGLGGVKKVLEDSLYAESIVYQYVDIEAVTDYFSKINSDYVAKRVKLGINKKILVTNSPSAKKYFTDHAETLINMRIIDHDQVPFGVSMLIYDNKVSYITIGENENDLIGVIIEDERLAKMHMYLFEALYKVSKNTQD